MAENQPENQEAVVPAVGVAQMPRELSPIHRWVSRDVLGASPILSQAYLDELKLSGVIFGGGELEGRYRVEAARPGDRVCYLNLDHPTVPNWLWVNEVMFTEFGVRVPFTIFQQRLLNRASVAPPQLHPNAWSGIRCFELVTDSLRLPQDPEVFLYLFTLFSPNTEGKTKKGYMSVRPGKHRKVFGLYEDSFHDFKGRFFKIFPVGEHRPFWLSLEGQGRFPPYWSRDAGMDYVPVTYKGLNSDQKDTADILVKLFFERNLKPKTVLSNPSEAREAIVDMARKQVTLERLRRLTRPGSSQSVPAVPVPAPGPSRTPVEPQPVPAGDEVAFPEGGLPSPPPSPRVHSGKRPADDATAGPKRPRISEGTNREFCSMDRSFDASGFIASNLLGPRPQEVLKDYDPMESIRWAEWASLRAATIMKSIEPRRCIKLNGDLKALDLQRVEAEKGKLVAEQAKVKAEGDLKSLSEKLEVLEREKARAEKAEASLAESERSHDEVVRMAEDSVVATERALKDQISLLLPDFDVSQLGAFKVIVDGKIVDLPE
ncbi:hypothetical protein PIB30_059630 [Stylosanthes scabra]|uniref:Uncharacterized protein n=1 Tax=Stylosanthes scabra TaxID=79078 RepID=A0ABU6UL59_9FABA|nr:hypothetical protein [Stylosanthes scabra]